MSNIKRLLEMAYYNEMTNLYPKDTGLAMCIYVSSKDGLRHGPRIKLFDKHGACTRGTKTVTLTFDRTSNKVELIGKPEELTNQDIEKAKQWINLNKEVLIKLYDKDIANDKAKSMFKKI